MAKLGEVCKVSPSTKNIERQGAWLLNLDMVEQQTGRVVEYNFVDEDGLNASITQFDTENVLYSKLRPNLNKVVLPERNGFCTSELLPLRPDARKLDRSYLAVFLRSDGFVNWAVSKTAGAKMPRLGTKDLLNANIPLPEIKEQKAIAEKFEKLEELIFLRKQQIVKLDELVKARFVEMFGESEYPCNSLISLITEGAGLSYGIVQPGDDGTGDMGVLRPVDFADGKIKTDSIKYIDRSLGDGFKKTELNGNELLITVRGTTGITALTDSRFKGMNVTRGIAVIRYDEKKIDPIYLNEYLKMEESQQYIKEHTRGATLQQINLSDLRDLKVMVPPLLLQQAFSTFVERVNQQKQTVQQSLEKLELMKKALMQEYFG